MAMTMVNDDDDDDDDADSDGADGSDVTPLLMGGVGMGLVSSLMVTTMVQ